jgi:predicted DNA-binding protein (UPF0278 family)
MAYKVKIIVFIGYIIIKKKPNKYEIAFCSFVLSFKSLLVGKIFKINNSCHETEMVIQKIKKNLNKIINHHKIKKETNSNQNNKDQI